MPIDPSIPLGARSFSLGNTFADAFQQGSQMRFQRDAQQAAIEERRAQTEELTRKTNEARRQQFEEQTLATLFGSGQPVDPKAVYSVVGPKRGADILKGISALQEQNLKTDDALKTHVNAIVGGILALPPGLRQNGYDRARQNFIQQGIATADDLPAEYSDDYAKAARKWATTPKEQLDQEAQAARDKIAADSAAAQLPGQVADAAMKQQVAAGMRGGLTPEQQATQQNARGQLAVSQGNLAVSRQREAREAATAQSAQGDVTDLTQEGLDAAATMFAKTGQLPALGMGDKQTRKKIINRAAAMMPGLDIASAKADYGANSKSLDNVTKTLDTLTAFENTAGKNLDQFLSLASKVPDTGVPWLNQPIRSVNASGLGSADQAAFNAARVVALREIARVTNDPKLSGVLSDSARKEVSDLAPDSATFAQIRAVAKTLKTDMANVHSSLSDQRDAITGRLKKGSGTAPSPTPTGMIRARDPQGNIHEAPAGTPLPQGWTQVGG